MDSLLMQHSSSELICSICKDYFLNPVTITCGHSFCTPCLCLLWENTQTPARCPLCRTISQQMDFESTILVKKQALSTEESVVCQSPSPAEQICKIHRAIQNIFCQTDKSLLCLFCSYTPGHATHRHRPVKQVAEHYRENILMQMKSIWKNKQKNQINLNKEINKFRVWEGFINLRMLMIRAEYPKVYQYLHGELEKHLAILESEGRMIFQRLQRNVIRMIHTRKLMISIYEGLKKLYQKTDVDLLQDSGDIVIKSQLVQQYLPQPVEPRLSTWAITGMSERLNNFRVYITFDHKIRKYDAPLFEELRHLKCSPDHQDTSHNPASSEYTPSWGAQIFTSGKHYWEVDVGNSRNWIIGLCKESWVNRNDMLLNSEGIFLLLCVKMDDHVNLFSTSPLIHQYIQRPQDWIGVFLDYECGLISFINVARSSLICNFLSCSFSFALRPFICFGPN
ncbi:tripartite motif-containing protein 77 [Rousettus aegyptiacus]|uniref:Tripartite motif containing 77 n=1 Tax=Rousettus aegyptiacus TaxID=9407 RepID=A0A7J8H827_ROUAE|nr:tripartite motif-containing protein 77 [Rousettus aegyptiacus]KAF6468427.1 tripartite motif containing 77 [Rousettus aegyptiacus]